MGWIKQVVNSLKRRRRKREEKVSLVGVQHITKIFPQYRRKNKNLKRLYLEMKKWKANRIQRIGIESVITELDPADRLDYSLRYFYGVNLLAKRIGIQLVEVDDPLLCYLQRGFDIRVQDPRVLRVKQWVDQTLQKISPNISLQDKRLLDYLISFRRTQAMVMNARREKLPIIITGKNHLVGISKRDFNHVSLDGQSSNSRLILRALRSERLSKLADQLIVLFRDQFYI